GRRSDSAQQYAQSGGIGIFRDAGAGKDRYMCSTFCEGSGYWFGTGLFQDGGGDDTYDGFWYVQGANAHMALTWFADEGGTDTYKAPDQPMGAANDAIWAGNFNTMHVEAARKGAGGDDAAGTVSLP